MKFGHHLVHGEHFFQIMPVIQFPQLGSSLHKRIGHYGCMLTTTPLEVGDVVILHDNCDEVSQAFKYVASKLGLVCVAARHQHIGALLQVMGPCHEIILGDEIHIKYAHRPSDNVKKLSRLWQQMQLSECFLVFKPGVQCEDDESKAAA